MRLISLITAALLHKGEIMFMCVYVYSRNLTHVLRNFTTYQHRFRMPGNEVSWRGKAVTRQHIRFPNKLANLRSSRLAELATSGILLVCIDAVLCI